MCGSCYSRSRLPPTSTLFPYTTLFRSVLYVLDEPSIGLHHRDNARLLQALEALRSEEHTSELQSPMYLVCRLLLEKKIIRVYSGVLSSGDTVYTSMKGKKERIGRLLQM